MDLGNNKSAEDFHNYLDDINTAISDGMFIDKDMWNFELDSTSPAINIGSENTALLVPFDINGNSRIVLPDLGCFERIE